MPHPYGSQHFNSHNLEQSAATDDALRQQNERLAKTLQVVARRYSDLFEASPFGCLITDVHGNIIQANTAACTLLNFPHPWIIGQSLADILGIEFLQRVQAAPSAAHETLLTLATGEQIYLQIHCRESGDQIIWQCCDLTAHWQREQAERERLRTEAITAERERLARDLHDSVTQTLFSATVLAESMPRLSPDRLMRNLEQLQILTRGALAEMRTLLLELHPQYLKNGLLREQLQHLANALRSRKTIEIALAVEDSHPVPGDVQVALYRITQEAFNNIRKHSSATRVELIYRTKPYVELVIRDNGHGFDLATTPPNLGLLSMRERAEAIGADFRLKSLAGQGTEIIVVWDKRNG